MDWFPLDADVFGNPKVVRAGHDAACLYLWGLGYAAKYETDGFIPEEALDMVPPFWVKRPRAVVGRLLAVVELPGRDPAPLWERADLGTGYRIHDFTKKQRTHAEMEADRAKKASDREAAKKRMADLRSGRRSPPVTPDVREVFGERSRLDSTGTEQVQEQPEELASDVKVGSSLERGSGGEPDVFDEGQEEGQVEAKIQARFGLVLADDQVYNLAQLAKANPLFGDVWPGLFEGRTMAVVSEALMRARTRDLDAVTHPRSWLKALMDEVGPTIGAPEANGSDPKTDQKPARKRAKKSAES